MRELCAQVHAQVNRDITWTSDLEQYGLPDFWEAKRGQAREDCDGHMLTCRMRLLEAGVPHERIFLQLGWTETDEYHAWLRVRLDDTDVCLDLRQAALATPAELVRMGYRFHEHIRSDGVDGWRESLVR